MERTHHLFKFVFLILLLLGLCMNRVRGGVERGKKGEEIVKKSADMRVVNIQDGMAVDTGEMRFELGHQGVLRALHVGDKALVADNDAPFLTASVLESEGYNGWRDYAPGKVVEATYEPMRHDCVHDVEHFGTTYTGRLDFGAGDSIDCELTLTTSAGSRFLEAAVQLTPQGSFEDRFIRSVALKLPLALNKRKRGVTSLSIRTPRAITISGAPRARPPRR